MPDVLQTFNHARYDPAARTGFYESYFQRANHPTRPLAFWVRYTVFSPDGRPDEAIGELWAVFFDGEARQHRVAKSEFPVGEVSFGRDGLAARIGPATLKPGALKGIAEGRGRRIQWDLTYRGDAPPLFLLPPSLYEGSFPKAKSLVGTPLARYDGELVVDGLRIPVSDWVGSQNHNWGIQHTDRYAWGQVAGFDNAPDSFLEVATGRLKYGPLWSPPITPLVLRHEGQEYALRTLWQAIVHARGRFGYFHWDFETRAPGLAIEGRIEAPWGAFVGLQYHNPPGGDKHCLNSKLASCCLVLRRKGQPEQVLETQHRAAFEILTDDLGHGVEIRA